MDGFGFGDQMLILLVFMVKWGLVGGILTMCVRRDLPTGVGSLLTSRRRTHCDYQMLVYNLNNKDLMIRINVFDVTDQK